MKTQKLKIKALKVQSFVTAKPQNRRAKGLGNDGGYTWVG